MAFDRHVINSTRAMGLGPTRESIAPWSACSAVVCRSLTGPTAPSRKRRAKTVREDARWLRELLADERSPEAWIPPEHVRQWRSRARRRHTLIEERTQ